MRQTKLGGLDVRITGGTDGSGAGDGPLVVLLHGFGAPGDDLVPLWRAFDIRAASAVRFAFPEAPIALGGPYAAGRAWWWIDLDARAARAMAQARGESAWDIEEVPEGLASARARVVAMLEEVTAALRPSKTVLGGFSQGAMLSLDVALATGSDADAAHAVPLAGLLLLSGTHIAANEWRAHLESGARRGLRVFMSHGRADPLLSFMTAERLRGALTDAGLAVDWLPFGGGHGIPPEVVIALGKFLSETLV